MGRSHVRTALRRTHEEAQPWMRAAGPTGDPASARELTVAMHEAGIAALAVDAALAEATGAGLLDRPPAGLDVVIDPGRVVADAIAFHLELALRDHGLAGLEIAIVSDAVACPACGAAESSDAWLLCETCGALLPARDGPMVEAHFRY